MFMPFVPTRFVNTHARIHVAEKKKVKNETHNLEEEVRLRGRGRGRPGGRERELKTRKVDIAANEWEE